MIFTDVIQIKSQKNRFSGGAYAGFLKFQRQCQSGQDLNCQSLWVWVLDVSLNPLLTTKATVLKCAHDIFMVSFLVNVKPDAQMVECQLQNRHELVPTELMFPLRYRTITRSLKKRNLRCTKLKIKIICLKFFKKNWQNEQRISLQSRNYFRNELRRIFLHKSQKLHTLFFKNGRLWVQF